MRVISRCWAVFFFFLPALLQAAAPENASVARGRQIYLEGTSPSGGEIVAVMSDAGVEVPASAVPCAGCHGRVGYRRGVVVRSLREDLEVPSFCSSFPGSPSVVSVTNGTQSM